MPVKGVATDVTDGQSIVIIRDLHQTVLITVKAHYTVTAVSLFFIDETVSLDLVHYIFAVIAYTVLIAVGVLCKVRRCITATGVRPAVSKLILIFFGGVYVTYQIPSAHIAEFVTIVIIVRLKALRDTSTGKDLHVRILVYIEVIIVISVRLAHIIFALITLAVIIIVIMRLKISFLEISAIAGVDFLVRIRFCFIIILVLVTLYILVYCSECIQGEGDNDLATYRTVCLKGDTDLIPLNITA